MEYIFNKDILMLSEPKVSYGVCAIVNGSAYMYHAEFKKWYPNDQLISYNYQSDLLLEALRSAVRLLNNPKEKTVRGYVPEYFIELAKNTLSENADKFLSENGYTHNEFLAKVKESTCQ